MHRSLNLIVYEQSPWQAHAYILLCFTLVMHLEATRKKRVEQIRKLRALEMLNLKNSTERKDLLEALQYSQPEAAKSYREHLKKQRKRI